MIADFDCQKYHVVLKDRNGWKEIEMQRKREREEEITYDVRAGVMERWGCTELRRGRHFGTQITKDRGIRLKT